MPAMPRPKKQHFVPELHLKHFVGTEPPGMVWTYDVKSGRVAPSLPTETGSETNFYSTLDENGQHVDVIETWLSEVEDKAANPYAKLLRGEIPSGQERADFATYLASLYARSPAMRRLNGQVLASGMLAKVKAVTEDPEAFEEARRALEAEGKLESPISREELLAFISDPSKYTLDVDRTATLPALLLSDRLQGPFFEMGWMVLGSNNQHIITCDSPVCRAADPRTIDPLCGDAGFANPTVQVTAPLSSNRCLYMGWRDDVPGVTPVPKEEARMLNRQRAHYAERFLYADRLDSGIKRLGQKHAEHGHRVSVSGMINDAELPAIQVVRKLKPS